MNTQMVGFANLDIVDDLDVAVDPETYRDQASPAPPAPGNYRAIIVKGGAKCKYQTQEPIIIDGKYPVLSIEQIKIVEPVECERLAFPYKDIKTKPFERQGTMATDLADILRAYDDTVALRGTRSMLDEFQKAMENNQPFLFQSGWSAYDSEMKKIAWEQFDLPTDWSVMDDEQKALANAVLKAARIYTKAFPIVNGKRQAHVTLNDVEIKQKTGPSLTVHVPTRTIEPRFEISRFYPSSESVVLGPFAVKG